VATLEQIFDRLAFSASDPSQKYACWFAFDSAADGRSESAADVAGSHQVGPLSASGHAGECGGLSTPTVKPTTPTRCSCRGVRRLAAHARLLLGRRWPSGIPSTRAFCLRAPGVRLSALEMVLTGVLSLECCLSSFTSARVQSRRTMRFLVAIVLAISFPIFSQALIAQTLAHECISLRESAAFMGRDMSAMGQRRTKWVLPNDARYSPASGPRLIGSHPDACCEDHGHESEEGRRLFQYRASS
jgi:hypothetical protein